MYVEKLKRDWVFLFSKHRTSSHTQSHSLTPKLIPRTHSLLVTAFRGKKNCWRFQYSDSIFPSPHSSFHGLNIASLKTRGNRGRVKDKHVDGGGKKKKEQGFMELGGAIFRAKHRASPALTAPPLVSSAPRWMREVIDMLESVSPLCVSLWLSPSIYALFVFSSTLGETDLYSRLLPIEIKNVKLKLSEEKRQEDRKTTS